MDNGHALLRRHSPDAPHILEQTFEDRRHEERRRPDERGLQLWRTRVTEVREQLCVNPVLAFADPAAEVEGRLTCVEHHKTRPRRVQLTWAELLRAGLEDVEDQA